MIVSLDLETSGIEPGKHQTIAIGAVKIDVDGRSINDANSFYAQLEWDSLCVSPAAMRINKLNIVDPPGRNAPFVERSLPAQEAMDEFSKWLGESKIIALGKNVGSFDLPMLKACWGDKSSRPWPFSYRSIDLNSLFFTQAQITGRLFEDVRKEVTDRAWDAVDKKHAFKKEHHALADAIWNVFAWNECFKFFNGDVS